VDGLVFLDSKPLWLACKPPSLPEAKACRDWLTALEIAGVQVVIPEIVDYEVRRELVRARATAGLDRLNRLLARFVLLLLDRDSMLLAADFWARVRQAGMATAGDEALDGDAILAAQALTAVGEGNIATVATGNVKHLARFPGIDAREWRAIT
jgi:predicted nucleic acid-binding protein